MKNITSVAILLAAPWIAAAGAHYLPEWAGFPAIANAALIAIIAFMRLKPPNE